LTDDQLSEIAQVYMEKLGYGNQPFIVYKHVDIDSHHLHIVSIRVDKNGKKLDHNFEFRKSMEIGKLQLIEWQWNFKIFCINTWIYANFK